jgi:rsbT co-antagonist protein RsbR
MIGLCDHKGNLIAYALVNRDMTSQLQVETALLRSEQRNRALLAAIPDLMFVLSTDGIFLDCKTDNKDDELLLPPEAFLNRHVNEVLPPPLAAQALTYIERLKRTGEMQVYEYQLEFMGQLEEYEARMVPLQDGVLVLARNVTAQRRAERERVAMQEQIIQAQQATLRELSTPLMPIADGVVVMPLIGVIDSARAQQIMESLLNGVSEYKAHVALIDITGVKIIDTQVAGVLLRAAQAVRLLGAQVVLTGISPEIAQTLVHIGAEIRDVKTKATLQEGIRYAMTVGNRS